MPYCTVTDISNVLTEASVIQMTDDAGAGTIDQDKVDAAISSSDELINGYLRARYVLPLASTPPLLKDISVNLSIYNLYLRRFAASMPDPIVKSNTAQLSLLLQIQKGVISLGIEDVAEPAAGQLKTNKTADSRMFPKDSLDTY